MALLALGGCTLDFSQFPAGGDADQGSPGADAGDTDTGAQDDVGPSDMSGGADSGGADAGADMGVAPGAIGNACSEDADCDGTTCREGICTIGCAGPSDCPGDTACVQLASEGLCAVACTVGSCSPGFACSDPAGGCLPDGDADGTPDATDNCPGDPNAGQRDLDGDGLGDACDAEPQCAEGHVDGVLSRGPLPYAATDVALPEYSEQWIVAAGGLDETGALLDTLRAFDGLGTTTGQLPYAGTRFALAPRSARELLATPGEIGAGAQFGRVLHVFRNGNVVQGAPFSPNAFDPVAAATPAGRMVYVAYDGPAATSYTFYRQNDGEDGFSPIGSRDGTARAPWHVARDLRGTMVFYSDVLDLATLQGRYIEVGPDRDAINVSFVGYPNVDGAFAPVFSPAPGGLRYVWDRTTGRGFEFRGGSFTERAELALAHGLVNARWISQPSGPAVHVVGNPPEDPNVLVSTSFYLACMPAVAALDRDLDGTPDVRDLCPDNDLALGGDLDGDWIGDECDADADGDGIVDANDPAPLDTDNDGGTNDVDPDDDSDGIADDADPYPLDTDNDGLSNDVDLDDDNDGYADVDERAAGTSPFVRLHFPGSGTVVFVEGGAVKYAGLHELGAPNDLGRVGNGTPSDVRFAAGGSVVMLLDGGPGTTRVEYAPIAGGAQLYDVGVPVFGADAYVGDTGNLVEVILAHERAGEPARTDLSRLIRGDATFVPIVTVLTDITSPDVSGAEVVFLAQPPGCSDCRNAYLVDVAGGPPQIVAAQVSNPRAIRYNDSRITLLGDASDGAGQSAWFGNSANLVEFRPPGSTGVTAAVGYGDGMMIVAARDDGGDGLWLFDARASQWIRLVNTGGPVTDLDWAR